MINLNDLESAQTSLAAYAYERFLIGAGLINNPSGIIEASPDYIFLHPVAELDDPSALLSEASFMMLSGLRSAIKFANNPDVRIHGLTAMRSELADVLPALDMAAAQAMLRLEQAYGIEAQGVILWAPEPLQTRRTYRDICGSLGRLRIGKLIGDLPVSERFTWNIPELPVPEWALAHVKSSKDDETTDQELPESEEVI